MKRSSDESVQASSKTPKLLPREKTTLTSVGRDPVHVFCRLRPLTGDIESPCVKLLSATTLSMVAESKTARKECNYVFKHIFTSYSNQREIFEHIALPMLEDLIVGKNGLLFTYGVTGSGKTFTLTGDQSNPGIMPRCIDTLFNTIGDYQAQKYLIKSDKMNGFEIQSEREALEERFLDTKSNNKKLRSLKKNSGDGKAFYINDGTKLTNFCANNKFAVFVTYTEIYNNNVYDLLDESAGKVLQGKIVREDSQKNMYVNGVVEVEVKSAAEAFELFYLGQKRKRMAHTILNAESSRSHSIFNIRVVQLQQVVQNKKGQSMIPDQNLLKISQLSFVDLAGSERCSRTQNTGIRLKEASSINNSLMSLRTCLEILRENQLTGSNKLVPYRDSRLTLLFKNYFEGDGRVQMIVCVNPSIQDYDENLQVLKFAERTQDVKVPRSEAKYTPYRKTPKTIKSARSTVQPPSSSRIKKPLSFSLGPKIPNIKINFENCAENEPILDNLIKILYSRKQKRETYKKQLVEKEDHTRKRLVQINQETILAKSEIRNFKALLKKQKQTSNNLEYKVTDLETVNENLATKNEELQEIIRTLQSTIDEKNLKINQNILECAKKKQKLVLQNEKMNQELEEKLRKQRAHHEAELKFKELKLKKVREIIENDSAIVVAATPDRQPDYQPQQTPPLDTFHRRDAHKSAVRQRRSRSAGEIWLEHNAVKPVALGTVFQPSMKKRKSLTKLDKAKDITNPKQNRYCLIAQEPQTDGEMETKLYKGDILPTCGGGAQVIFSEVERLRQESPTADKK